MGFGDGRLKGVRKLKRHEDRIHTMLGYSEKQRFKCATMDPEYVDLFDHLYNLQLFKKNCMGCKDSQCYRDVI